MEKPIVWKPSGSIIAAFITVAVALFTGTWVLSADSEAIKQRLLNVEHSNARIIQILDKIAPNTIKQIRADAAEKDD